MSPLLYEILSIYPSVMQLDALLLKSGIIKEKKNIKRNNLCLPMNNLHFTNNNLKLSQDKTFVPGTGLEPAHLAAYAPQTYVSTNSTTRALRTIK